ncbi:MAG: PIN domain-containing protein [Actinobacteria bacterium]|nr:PIN domain-containing protein [Actinomycetota bacterium]
MIILDTSVLYALLDRRDRRHDEAALWYSQTDEEMATTPLIVAEVDHLARTRTGRRAVEAFHRDLAGGAYLVEWWPGAAARIVEVAGHYSGLDLGLADASLIALAERLGTTALATFDERHFRAVRPLTGGLAFALAPTDS